ncbi:uncharacterized protein LOC126845619 isoform X2 [Adelges cooleyi]|uniref:uncharacterized protein LOC126845619 isoform X2 n=1 Tax=Adelges cooleyi TaxID=133065 RepID=UPI00217FB741|nr:uncharacterized protein LOC126845619 isoform X2 [Adelges cooleyi]
MAFSKYICFSLTIAAISIASLSVVSCVKSGTFVDGGDSKEPESANDLPTITRPLVVQNFDACLSSYIGDRNEIVLLLDYDGTLTDIVQRPEMATIPDDTKTVLQTLAGMPNVHVAIISGRGLGDLKKMVGINDLTYAGNTGLDIIFPNGDDFKFLIPAPMKITFDNLKNSLEKEVCKHGAWVEDKGPTMTYHYREVPDSLRPELVERAHFLIEKAEFKAGKAHCAIEVTPPVDWDKGHAALYILNKFFPRNWMEIPTIFVGDDTNDEYAMKALQRTAVTFRVDATKTVDTLAKYRLLNPTCVLAMLKWVLRRFNT